MPKYISILLQIFTLSICTVHIGGGDEEMMGVVAFFHKKKLRKNREIKYYT